MTAPLVEHHVTDLTYERTRRVAVPPDPTALPGNVQMLLATYRQMEGRLCDARGRTPELRQRLNPAPLRDAEKAAAALLDGKDDPGDVEYDEAHRAYDQHMRELKVLDAACDQAASAFAKAVREAAPEACREVGRLVEREGQPVRDLIADMRFALLAYVARRQTLAWLTAVRDGQRTPKAANSSLHVDELLHELQQMVDAEPRP